MLKTDSIGFHEENYNSILWVDHAFVYIYLTKIEDMKVTEPKSWYKNIKII